MTAKPATAKPAAPKPRVSKPRVTKPKVVKPRVTKPKTTKAKVKRAPAKRTQVKKPLTPDNLQKIKGIGAQNESRLNKVGVLTFAQIAKWTTKEQKEMGERLAFPGRIEREEWVKQAAILAKGGQTEFAKRVVKGQVSTSRPTPKKK